MNGRELYVMTAFISRLLNYDKLNEKDYIQVLKSLFQLQFLLTRVVTIRIYRLFLADFVGKHLPVGIHLPVGQRETDDAGEKGEEDMAALTSLVGCVAEQKTSDTTASSLIMMPFNTVKAATKAGVTLTSKVTGAPVQAYRYATDMSWGMMSKVTNTLIGRHVQEKLPAPAVMDQAGKQNFIERLLKAKEASGKTFRQIAHECSITSVYCAQLFHNQAQLKPEVADCLQQSVPNLTKEDISNMSRSPKRSYDAHIVQEPIISRLNETTCHYGESIKALINEEFGDGIMSTEDFCLTVNKMKGPAEEDRVVITLNGKFVAYESPLSNGYKHN